MFQLTANTIYSKLCNPLSIVIMILKRDIPPKIQNQLEYLLLDGKPIEKKIEKLKKIILDNKINLNKKTKEQQTVLMYSFNLGEDFINFLIMNGADVNMNDDDGYQALHYYLRNKAPYEEIKMLLDHGASIHGKTIWGETPIMFAAAHHDIRCFITIKEKGAILDCQDKFSMTPLLYFYMFNENHNMLKSLIENGLIIDFASLEDWKEVYKNSLKTEGQIRKIDSICKETSPINQESSI